MFISFQKILPIGIKLSEILRPKHGQKTQKTPKIDQIAHFRPIYQNIYFRKIAPSDLYFIRVLGRGTLELPPARKIFLAHLEFQNL